MNSWRGRVIMKKIIRILGMCFLLLLSAACGKSTAEKWQEQYDLGQQYLLEENYEEAIVAFTAAIEIDPNQVDAYIGRGDAYFAWTEKEGSSEKYQSALSDYERAESLQEQSEVIAKKLEYLRDPFMRKDNFVPESKFSEEQISYIKELEQILSQEDLNSVLEYVIETEGKISEIVAQTSPIYKELVASQGIENEAYFGQCHTYTFIDQKKVDIYSTFGNQSGNTFGVEIHPLNGQGYYINFLRINRDSEELKNAESYPNGSYQLDYMYGECRSWNWNGTYSIIHDEHSFGMDTLGRYEITYTNGNAKNGYIDGEVSSYKKGYTSTYLFDAGIALFTGNEIQEGDFYVSEYDHKTEEYENGRLLNSEYWQDYLIMPARMIPDTEDPSQYLW